MRCTSWAFPASCTRAAVETETLDMIVETGIDALRAMQPSAHNDIRQIKKLFGKRISLIGNVDISRLLPLEARGMWTRM